MHLECHASLSQQDNLPHSGLFSSPDLLHCFLQCSLLFSLNLVSHIYFCFITILDLINIFFQDASELTSRITSIDILSMLGDEATLSTSILTDSILIYIYISEMGERSLASICYHKWRWILQCPSRQR